MNLLDKIPILLYMIPVLLVMIPVLVDMIPVLLDIISVLLDMIPVLLDMIPFGLHEDTEVMKVLVIGWFCFFYFNKKISCKCFLIFPLKLFFTSKIYL